MLGIYSAAAESASAWLTILSESSKAGSQKDADSLRGRAEGIPRGHRVHLPGDAGSALHRPPGAQLPPLCQLEGQATVCPRHEGEWDAFIGVLKEGQATVCPRHEGRLANALTVVSGETGSSLPAT